MPFHVSSASAEFGRKEGASMKVKSLRARIGDWIFVLLCVVIALICVIPMINLLAKSLSGSEFLVRHEVYLWPKGFNLTAYSYVFEEPTGKYVRAFFWTAFLTLVCTLLSLFMTALCAYPLIFDGLKGKGVINVVITITMFFNAGTIPNYLLMKQLNFIDNPLVLIVPSCLSVYNMIIMRSFFYGIPESLRESAQIDGASFFTILGKIYLPLSKPVFASLALFYAVGRWNGYSDSLMYMTNKKMFTLQHLLYNILKAIESVAEIATQEGSTPPGLNESMKAAVVMFSTVPILVVYPFLQKYFISGVTMGAVKE